MKQIKKKKEQISECPNILKVFLEIILNQDAIIILTKKDVILVLLKHKILKILKLSLSFIT